MAYSRLSDQNWLVSESQDLRDPGFPTPEGSVLGRREKTGFQPQLYLDVPPELIWDHSRAYGYVANIRHDAVQLNTRSPFTFQIVFRPSFWDRQANGYETIFTKIAAHSADYAFQMPIVSPDTFTSVRVGDPVTGVLKPTQSSEKTIQLKAWSRTTWQEWEYAPRQHMPNNSEFCLVPEIIRELPALVSKQFRNFASTHQAYTAQIFPPVFDANNLRTMAAGAGSVDKIWEDGRGSTVRDPCHLATNRQERSQAAPSSVPPTIREEDSLAGSEWDSVSQARERTMGDLPASIATEISRLRISAARDGGDALYSQIYLEQLESDWGIKSSRQSNDGWFSETPSVVVVQTRPKPPPPSPPPQAKDFASAWEAVSDYFIVPSERDNRREEDAESGISRLPTIVGGLPLGGPPRRLCKAPPPKLRQV